MNASPSLATPARGAAATPSSTARSADRAIRSSAPCPTIGRTRHSRISRFVRDCAAEYGDPLDRRFHAEPLGLCRLRPGACTGAVAGRRRSTATAAALAAALCALRDGANRRRARRRRLSLAVRCAQRANGRPAAGQQGAAGKAARGDGALARRATASSTRAASACLSPPEADGASQQRPAHRARRAAAARAARRIRRPGLARGRPHAALQSAASFAARRLRRRTGRNLRQRERRAGADASPRRRKCGLRGVADGFLHHDRPIARPADDPVVRVLRGAVRPLRLGRGIAPLELDLPSAAAMPTLAVGAYMKTTVALAWGHRAVVSPHIGELGSPRGRQVFAQVADDLQQLYGVRAERIAHDAHSGLPQHPLGARFGAAHPGGLAPSCACRGGGRGVSRATCHCSASRGTASVSARTIRCGAARRCSARPGAWQRVASFRPFRLPGGERAAREPWRSALGLCWESGGSWRRQTVGRRPMLRRAFDGGVNTPPTTAVGRLFDAAAALLGVCQQASYEGEAPMRLEALCTEPGRIPLPCRSRAMRPASGEATGRRSCWRCWRLAMRRPPARPCFTRLSRRPCASRRSRYASTPGCCAWA